MKPASSKYLDEKFMRLAIQQAKIGIRKNQTPFGCCIVKGKKVISEAHNLVFQNSDITAHAEIQAIQKACQKLKKINLSGCTLYATCEPCPMCFTASHWARIKRIVYGADIADAKRAKFHELTVSSKILKQRGKSPLKLSAGVLRNECRALFLIWSKRKNKRVY